MAKKDKTQTEGGETAAAETEKKVAAPKVEKVYFLDTKYADPKSVFGHIKGIIAAHQNLAEGKGVATPFIVEEMQRTYTPKKTARYGESYIRSYVRDLEKFHYATTDVSKAVAELTQAPVSEKAASTGSKKKSGGVSDAGRRVLNAMGEMISEDEYKSNTSTVTTEALATKLGVKSQLTLGKTIESLVKNELVALRKEGDNVLLNFTEKSWGVNYSEPVAAAA